MDDSREQKCYICGCKDISDSGYSLRDNKDLQVLRCNRCSLIFLSSFEHINREFYKEGKMHGADFEAEKWLAASKHDDERRFFSLKDKIKNKKLLDFGCGAGGFLLMAKKVALEVVGIEQQESLKSFFSKNSISVFEKISDVNKKFDVITMFHVLEHLPEPKIVLKQLMDILEDNGEIIIEVPNSDDALLKLYRCKSFADFTHWSCHLFSFNAENLKILFSDMNIKINYIKPIQRYGFANHLYWIIKGKKGGHEIWKNLDNPIFNFFYINFLKLIFQTDTIIVSISKNKVF